MHVENKVLFAAQPRGCPVFGHGFDNEGKFMGRILVSALSIASLVFSSSSQGQVTEDQAILIDAGRKVFMEETFDGNGRSCGTCHLPAEGYDIFPSSIEKLSKKEQALVFASNVPGFENEDLIRSFALFNISGGPAPLCGGDEPFCFDDADGHHGPTFRASMAIQALDLTTQMNELAVAEDEFHGTPLLSPECSEGVELELPQLGWSGDGSPGTPKVIDEVCQTHHGEFDADSDGSFRAFATGAIAQHFTLSLERIPGVDFRRGTAEELDALETFQRWLGRRPLTVEENTKQGTENATEFEILLLDFKDPRVALGRDHFASNDGATCNRCHDDAGALSADNRRNDNNLTKVSLSADDIGLVAVGYPLPEDEGVIVTAFSGGDTGVRFGAFNSQSIIEAAEKKAWFHNHKAVDDFEAAITHYGSDDFLTGVPANRPVSAVKPEGGMEGLKFGGQRGVAPAFPAGDGIEHLGAFLRALNAFYNLRDCERLIGEAVERLDLNVSAENPLEHCLLNLDAVSRVLSESKLASLHQDVQKEAKHARNRLIAVQAEAELAVGKPKVDTQKVARLKAKLDDIDFSIYEMRDSIATQMTPL
jgi:hypothetical protein